MTIQTALTLDYAVPDMVLQHQYDKSGISMESEEILSTFQNDKFVGQVSKSHRVDLWEKNSLIHKLSIKYQDNQSNYLDSEVVDADLVK